MSKINLTQSQYEDHLTLLVAKMRRRLEKINEGGGAKKIEKLHGEGKLSARERIEGLLDKNMPSIEIGAFAGFELYEEHGGCPAGGVVVVIGYVKGRQCVVVANDATVKAGAWFPITAKKNLRAQEIAMENRLPIIYLVDSAGVYLPMQDEIFPDKENFGRIFRNNAIMSSMGITQIAAIMGSCVADDLLGLHIDGDNQHAYNEAIKLGIKEKVSGYAEKNIKEFIAECWAESCNSEQPREFARRIAEIVRARYRSRFPATNA